ncbi:hypothetical protein H5V45_00355 [Nocardioides sp. KIGAM211]|uniref:DM13 domain-containing protein n=1 Tax=Nocardioides luti TaxID=2761101 RepID=A0A7X0RCM5_9ACTN|nr:hypothetical protein [Nocardioides luti]MBB6625757.1 hypothetical protein [Nocardioides luti]
MRTQLITGSLAVVATSALIGLGAAPAHAATTTETERGHLVECTGTIHGKDVYASVYENETYGNVFQLVVGEKGTSREAAKPFLDGSDVRAVLTLAGKKAVVKGTADRVGKKLPVHEEMDDAGQHITVDGFHKRLATDLTLRWGSRTVPLDCDNAFRYVLEVTKTDIE